jgi:hypothetical protein
MDVQAVLFQLLGQGGLQQYQFYRDLVTVFGTFGDLCELEVTFLGSKKIVDFMPLNRRLSEK